MLFDALLGHTGLVGSHLRENLDPDTTKYFNSKNILDVKDQIFDTVYCACIPAVKWKANADPEKDSEEIDKLENVLASIKCRIFILISTIDVHNPEVLNQVEDDVHETSETYGKNRFQLEVKLRKHFRDQLLIIRLPSLFGIGLKKNYIYDMMNKNQIENININSSLQWYYLGWLWEDVQNWKGKGERVVNLYSEPIETEYIVKEYFPQMDPATLQYGPRVIYCQSSKNGLKSKRQVLIALDEYLGMEKLKKSANRLVVSNMAWKVKHNEHAIFLLKRYGVKNIEILPTKFAATWDEIFKTNLEKELECFVRNDIKVYSVQSVFHKVEGQFGDEHITQHLMKVVRFCEQVGAEVLVMGSPNMRGRRCDKKTLGDVLEKVQALTRVKICLEPNSTMYRCSVGTTIDSCNDVRGKRHFWLNYDTGNAYMEHDRLPTSTDKIAHIQISNARLNPMRATDYMRIVSSGMCGAINELLETSNISLEISTFDNIKQLGEQIQRFARFYCMYFMT